MAWKNVLSIAGIWKAGSPAAVSDADPLPTKTIESEFSRISSKAFYDVEEARFDIPASLPNASIYVGVAVDGTATSSADWAVVRTYFDANGNPNRQRIRFDLAWDDRAVGW